MKSIRLPVFEYIPIRGRDRRLFCLKQSLAVLAWVLYWHKDPFRPGSGLVQKKSKLGFLVSWLRRNVGIFRLNFRLLIQFACYKYKLRSLGTVVYLPFYGQIVVPVHKGYKIFDFPKGLVRKWFDKGVDPRIISNEIEQMRYISKINFAPSIQKWSVEEGWYEENFISGSIDASYAPMDSRTLLKKFSNDVVQPLNELIFFQKPKSQYPEQYIKGMIKNIEDSRLSKQESTNKEFKEIKRFLDSMFECFQQEEARPVFFVFSHGDFCPENMLNTKQGMKVIDWESTKWRTVLFDFYSYFFYRSALKDVSAHILESEMKEGLRILISKLIRRAPDIAQNILEMEGIYRWIYYIERISMLVEREATDKNLDILRDHIMKYIGAFQNYEEILVEKSRMIA